ncbi:hypothetical protein K1719_036633 [Acacia pycnantha]|nr:hypothetical protein K1719_036633 [Acacia pycnantha]
MARHRRRVFHHRVVKLRVPDWLRRRSILAQDLFLLMDENGARGRFWGRFGSEAAAAVFTLQNKCRETIWPAILTAAGKPQLMDGGVQLRPNQTIDIVAPKGWSGRLWGRRHCSFDASGNRMCVTGDCGGKLKCNGAGGMPPATLAKFTLDSPMDFYDVSLVDGYNMPVSIFPSGGSGTLENSITLANASYQIIQGPLRQLVLWLIVMLMSYDDATSTFTCQGANYLIRFC